MEDENNVEVAYTVALDVVHEEQGNNVEGNNVEVDNVEGEGENVNVEATFSVDTPQEISAAADGESDSNTDNKTEIEQDEQVNFTVDVNVDAVVDVDAVADVDAKVSEDNDEPESPAEEDQEPEDLCQTNIPEEPEDLMTEPETVTDIPQTNGHINQEPEVEEQETDEYEEKVEDVPRVEEHIPEPVPEPIPEKEEKTEAPTNSQSSKEVLKPVRVGDMKQRFDRKNEELNNNKVNKSGAPAKKEKGMFKVVQTEKCEACEKTVYAMEKLELNNHIYHKTCFKCSHCSARLTPKTFSMNEGVVYCTNHFKQLFARKGNYDEGFGRQQYKKKWTGSADGQKEVATA